MGSAVCSVRDVDFDHTIQWCTGLRRCLSSPINIHLYWPPGLVMRLGLIKQSNTLQPAKHASLRSSAVNMMVVILLHHFQHTHQPYATTWLTGAQHSRRQSDMKTDRLTPQRTYSSPPPDQSSNQLDSTVRWPSGLRRQLKEVS